MTSLKLGEEIDHSLADEERFGYALAHGMFADELRGRYPWTDFHQD